MLTLMIVYPSDPCPLPLGMVMDVGRGNIWKSYSLFFVQMELATFTQQVKIRVGKLVLALPNIEFSYILGLSAFCFSSLHHQEENDYGPKKSFRIPYVRMNTPRN